MIIIFQAMGAEEISKSNPVIVAQKVAKIWIHLINLGMLIVIKITFDYVFITFVFQWIPTPEYRDDLCAR